MVYSVKVVEFISVSEKSGVTLRKHPVMYRPTIQDSRKIHFLFDSNGSNQELTTCTMIHTVTQCQRCVFIHLLLFKKIVHTSVT